MSIAFSCEFCARKYKVDEKLAGRKVKCKECGADLLIPAPAAMLLTEANYAPKPQATRYAAKPQSLFDGLDDGDDVPSAPASRRGGSDAYAPMPRSSNGDFDARLWQFVGIGAAVAVAIPAALVMFAMLRGSGRAKPAAEAPRVVREDVPQPQNPGVTPPDFAPNMPPPNMPPPNFTPPAMPSAQPPGIFITLTDGKASHATNLLGRPGMGVDFRADYRLTGARPMGMQRFFTVVKGPRSRATGSWMLMGENSGNVGGSVPAMSQSDGPFEMFIEAEMAGPGGMTRHKVSETISLAWTELPQQAQQPQQQRPGFPNTGQPGNFPGQPGYRPPGMPNIPAPRFGPRGRR